MADARLTLFAASLALAGCHATTDDRAAAPANAQAPVTSTATAAPTPVANAVGDAPIDLAAYAGHYPFDAVQGVRFFDQPAIRDAVAALVPDQHVRELVLGAGDGPATPIAFKQGRLIAWGCETHNCGDHDWSVTIAPDGGDAAVCYHDQAAMGAASRWYVASGRTETRRGDCPSGDQSA